MASDVVPPANPNWSRDQSRLIDAVRDLQLAEKGVEFKVLDDPAIDTSSRTGKLVMGILALIAEFENDIRRERQMDGIAKAQDRGVRFGRKPLLVPDTVTKVRKLRKAGNTVPLCGLGQWGPHITTQPPATESPGYLFPS